MLLSPLRYNFFFKYTLHIHVSINLPQPLSKYSQNWMKNKNSIYFPNWQKFRIWAPFRPIFEIKYQHLLWPINKSLK